MIPITFLTQFENIVSLYCATYYSGHTILKYDDGENTLEQELESATPYITDLNAGIYRIWTEDPQGNASEEKYIEVYDETIEDQLNYVNDVALHIDNFNSIVDIIIDYCDRYEFNLVEALYLYYLNTRGQENNLDAFNLLNGIIRIYNNYNYYNNIDNNTIVHIDESNEAIIRPRLFNINESGKVLVRQFVGTEYELYDELYFNNDNLDLSHLKQDCLFRIDYVVDELIVNTYYVINPSKDIITKVWPKLKKVADALNEKLSSLQYLPIVYHKFDEETQLGISVLLDKEPDSIIYQMPTVQIDDGEIYVEIEGADHFEKLDDLYLCITDVEGLAADEILYRHKIDSTLTELSMIGNSIYNGIYYAYIADKNNKILSRITLFHTDLNVTHDYILAGLTAQYNQLMRGLNEEFVEEDVKRYSHYFRDVLGDETITISNYFDRAIQNLINKNSSVDFFDLIYYLSEYRYSHQAYRPNQIVINHDNSTHRVIIPPANDTNYVAAAIKYNSNQPYTYEYTRTTDNASYIDYSNTDYTVIAIFDEKVGINLGFVAIKRVGQDYYISTWNLQINNRLDF